MLFDLHGRTALVTGAGQHVGAGIARTLAAQGAHVLVNDIQAARAASVAESIASSHAGRASVAVFDVTECDAVRAAFEAAGPIDILVNNAGNAGTEAFRPRPFREADLSDVDRFLAVNFNGVLHCTKAVINGMCDRGWGRVITISSGAGIQGLKIGVSLYGGAKGASIAFMRHLSQEIAGSGVTVNTIALGLMDTTQDRTVTAGIARTIPAGRLGTGDDAGALVAYLASNEASWMTGQTISLNGGSN